MGAPVRRPERGRPAQVDRLAVDDERDGDQRLALKLHVSLSDRAESGAIVMRSDPLGVRRGHRLDETGCASNSGPRPSGPGR